MARNFKRIEFGFADAETESADFPDLLRKGYLDQTGAVEAALDKNTFLFLGFKGAGKTSLFEHLKLAHNDSRHMITPISLGEFSYRSLGKMIEGQTELESRLPHAWEYLMLIYVLRSLEKDEGKVVSPDSRFDEVLSHLRNCGIFPINKINQIVTKSATRKFKGGIPQIMGVAYESTTGGLQSDIMFLIEYLKELVTDIQTETKHYLLIDGLDDVLNNDDKQYKALVALINKAKTLNSFFRSTGLPVKIIVFCRTDIFDRLPDPNKNKIKRDLSYDFQWFDESIVSDPMSNNLVLLANLRARLAYPEEPELDIFKEFFPRNYGGEPTVKVLLDYTRHIPRDFLQLLKSVQKYARTTITSETLESGIKDYSKVYFLPELRDELTGYCSQDDIDDFISLLSIYHKQDFKISDLRAVAEQSGTGRDLNIEQILRILFDCSGIGLVVNDMINLKYRNPYLAFNPEAKMTLHKALWRAIR